MAMFHVGETVICSVEIKNSAGVLVDPATSTNIAIDCVAPSYRNVLASTAMTKDSTGKYHYDFQTGAETAGNYRAKYTATDGSRLTIGKGDFQLE